VSGGRSFSAGSTRQRPRWPISTRRERRPRSPRCSSYRREIALRRVRAKEAERFLARSREAALAAGIPALVAEVERAQRAAVVAVCTVIRAHREAGDRSKKWRRSSRPAI